MEKSGKNLVSACEEENFETIRELVLHGADINFRDALGRTPLLISVQKNNLTLVKYFIENGADQSIRDNTMLSPFLCAGANGFHEILEYLIKNGADVKSTNRFGGTALLPSSEKGFMRTVEICIDSGIDVNHVNDLGWSALQEAVILGDGGILYCDIIKALADAGALCDQTDNSGISTISYAKRNQQPKALEILESNPPDESSIAFVKKTARAGNYSEALEYLKEARESVSGELYSYYSGYLLTLLKKYDEALEAFSSQKESNPEFYFYTANTLRLMKKTNLCLAEYDAGIVKSSRPDFFRYHKSNYLREMGMHEEAVNQMRILLKNDPRRYDYSFHLANSLRSLGKHEEAVEAIENAIENDPRNPLYYLHKAKSFELLDSAENAKMFYKLAEGMR